MAEAELARPLPEAMTEAPLMTAVLALPMVLLAAVTAAACPDCPVGREARADVWNHDFAFNLLAALAPFVLIGLVSALVGSAPSKRRS